jgi:ABC-2 type transport system permease protein
MTLQQLFWVIFTRFEMLDGWTFNELLFLYNTNLLTYAISSAFFWGPMKELENIVRSGDFDLYLTKPIPPLRLLVLRQFGHTFIAHVILAVIVFVICFQNLKLQWSFAHVLFFVSIIAGATLIHSGLIIIAASCAFRVVRSTTIVDMTIYAVRNFINYPISIYARSVQFALTFFIPYAFVNYFPSTVFKIFYLGVRRYESTGT